MTHIPEHHEKKKGFFEKLFGNEETEEVIEPKERYVETGKLEATAAEGAVHGHATRRVVDEFEADTHKKAEAHVIDEREIVAPVEQRRVIEERVPRERVRIIEERTRLKFPQVAESERRKIIDTQEKRKPTERKVISEREVRLPIEHVKVIEESYYEEQVQVREEAQSLIGGEPGQIKGTEREIGSKASRTAGTVRTEGSSGVSTEPLKEELREATGMGRHHPTYKEGTHGTIREGAHGTLREGRLAEGEYQEGLVEEGAYRTRKEGAVGSSSAQLEKRPVKRNVVDEGDVTAVVELVRRIEEIEYVEIHRIIEEREPLEKYRDVQDFKRKYTPSKP